MLSIGLEQVAVQSPTFPQLIARQEQIETQHESEQHQLLSCDSNGW